MNTKCLTGLTTCPCGSDECTTKTDDERVAYWYPALDADLVGRPKDQVVYYVNWGDELIHFDRSNITYRTPWFKFKRAVRWRYDYIDAVLPTYISRWIADQLRRYSDWLGERTWYL